MLFGKSDRSPVAEALRREATARGRLFRDNSDAAREALAQAEAETARAHASVITAETERLNATVTRQADKRASVLRKIAHAARVIQSEAAVLVALDEDAAHLSVRHPDAGRGRDFADLATRVRLLAGDGSVTGDDRG
jgi:hypothetical protein